MATQSQTNQSSGNKQYNRLLVVNCKGVTEQQLLDEFSQYGTIVNSYFVKDKQTGDYKGLVYVSYNKTSEACLAQEEMNGKILTGLTKPIRVVFAAQKEDRDNRVDPERLKWVFVKVPTDFNHKNVKEEFKKYGDVEQVKILHNKEHESRGLSFIKFSRAYNAAVAVEECDPKYRAMFAGKKTTEAPPPQQFLHNNLPGLLPNLPQFGHNFQHQSLAGPPPPFQSNLPIEGDPLSGIPVSNNKELDIVVSYSVTSDQMHALLDLIPTFENCEFNPHTGKWLARFQSGRWASYAMQKLNQIEYPPGHALSVTVSTPASVSSALESTLQSLKAVASNPSTSNLKSIVDTLQQMTSVLSQACQSESVPFCSVPLPVKKPFASPDARCIKRVLLISNQGGLSEPVLLDILCRFGNLISVYIGDGGHSAHISFASMDSALEAVNTLNNQTLYGQIVQLNFAESEQHQQPPNKKYRY